MKIYFTGSIVGKDKYIAHYTHIIDTLKREKNSVTSDHIMNASENKITLQGEKAREQFHKQLKKWIMDAQCVVAETSFPSISVGFEISLALNMNKPVLVLFTGSPPTLLSGYNDEKMICAQYSLNTIDSIIEDFLLYVKGSGEHRFTFFLPTKMNQFLESVSRKSKIPKSVYLRQLIESAMDK